MLLQAVQSVRAQTWQNLEIIVVDDGSTDHTPEVASCLPDVLYLRQETAGAGVARNAGLARSRGTFIASLDSDDLWLPEFLERSMQALLRLNLDIVFSNWLQRDRLGADSPSYFVRRYPWDQFPEAEDLEDWRLMSPGQVRAVYTHSNPSPSSALLFRRAAIDGWPEGLQIADDWALMLESSVRRSIRLGFTARPLWIKRVFHDNIYDGGPASQVIPKLYLHDCKQMRSRFRPWLTKDEFASLSALIAFYYFRTALHNLTTLSMAAFGKNISSGVVTLGHALISSPKPALYRLLFLRAPVFRLGRNAETA